MSRASIAAHRAQDEVVATYRDRFGNPRLAQPGERAASALIVVLCLAGAVAAVVLGAVLS